MTKPGCVFCDVEGLTLTDIERKRLSHPLCGGVILFARNFSDVAQLRALTTEIKQLKKQPLLIAVDQEGGRVQRFREGFLRLPPLRELGELYDCSPEQATLQAQHYGWLMASECLAAGIDFSFAPVLDLDYGVSTVIGDRAFHRQPEVVTELAISYMRGMHRAGMPAVGKHFPGHGYVQADSHVGLPVDDRRLDDIADEDLQPFRSLAQAGIEGLMPAHVVYSDADFQTAGFSSFWLKDVLRGDLKFSGVVFSDDLSMEGAVKAAGNAESRANAALAAGCDMLLVCNDPAAADEVLNSLEDDQNRLTSTRYARMYGSHRYDWDELHASQLWHDTRSAIA